MSVTDPVDARLLAAVAELGKAAVHEVAATVGMDPREVAYRLVGLSGTGLPLLVGVESDPDGLRAALGGAWQPPGPPGEGRPVHGPPSGGHPVHGAPSGGYPAPAPAYGPPPTGPTHGSPSGPYQPYQPGPPAPPPPAAPQSPPAPPPPPGGTNAAFSTWGPPQTASWARGDQRPPAASPAGSSGAAQPGERTVPETAPARTSTIGDTLTTTGLEGERLAVHLLEVQDPADYLFGAAGYRLDEGERAVVVHTEVTNRGATSFASLPDSYLELVTDDGRTIGKAPVSLTSRPPHKIGVQPGETTGGHTVYLVGEAIRVTAVRWSPRPEPDERTLIWSVD